MDLDRYLQQAVDWYRIEVKLLGIPFGVDMEFVVYNKALFDEAGVDYPTDTWHVDELLAKALESGATDVHVEPLSTGALVRYRIGDPYKFLFRIRNVRETLRGLSEATMRTVVPAKRLPPAPRRSEP